MSVTVYGKFTNFEEPISGFVTVSLVGPTDYDGLFYDNACGVHFSKDHLWRADLEADGSWSVGPLPINSSISPLSAQGEALTFYKLNVVLNGKHVAVDTFLLTPNLAECVALEDISFNAISCRSTDHLCSFVKACETPWEGIEGCGISIVDNCPEATGHSPEIGVRISGDEYNQLGFGNDCGLYFSWDCSFLNFCGIGDLGDVCCQNPREGNVLRFNGEAWECDSAFAVEDLNRAELCDLGNVECIEPVDCSILIYRDGSWTAANPFDDRSFVIDDQCNISLVVSPDSCNQLRQTEDGLLVKPPVVNGAFTNCVETSVCGSGCDDDPYIVYADLTLSNDAENCLRCTENGLEVVSVYDFSVQVPELWCSDTDGFIPNQFFHTAALGDERIFRASFSVAQAPYGGDLILHVFDMSDQRVLDIVTLKGGATHVFSDKDYVLADGHMLGLKVDSAPSDQECAPSYLNAEFYYTRDCAIPN